MRALLLASMTLLSAAALGQSLLATAQKLVAAERKASLAQDMAWYEKNETADYVEIAQNGRKSTKVQAIAGMKSQSKVLKLKTMNADVLSAKTVGKDLVVQVRVHATGSLADPQGKAHTIDLTETVEDTWTKVGGEWHKRLERTLTQSGKLDGKALPQR